MLTTIYKTEDGRIVSLHLHAQTEGEEKQLQDAADHFNGVEDEPIAEVISAPAAQGSGSERGWDNGFSQEGDPYGILSEYVFQSANPDAATSDTAS